MYDDPLSAALFVMNIVLLALRYFVNSLLGFKFAAAFLKEKYGGKTKAFWLISATLLQLAAYYLFSFKDPAPLNSALNVLAVLSGLFGLLRLLFEGRTGKVVFTALCITGGIELASSLLHIIDYYILLNLCDLVLYTVDRISTEFYDAHSGILNFCVYFADAVIALAIYRLLYRLYLRLISNGFKNKDRDFSLYENLLLILPFASSICISITLKMMNNYSGAADESLYGRVPDAKFWVFAADVMLMAANIAYVKVFQRLADYNEEKEKSRLLETSVEQTKREIAEIEDIYSDIRGLRHDMQNHLTNVSLYINRKYGEDEELSDYLGKMGSTLCRLDFSGDTGNAMTDVIISRHSEEAAEKGISFRSDFAFPQNGGIEAYHIGVILSNALRNAIEACEREGEGYIYLSSYTKGSLFFIKCENSFSGRLVFSEEGGLPKTAKKNGELHGIGLSNIKRCAEKYMGAIDIKSDGNKYTLTAMLHMQTEKEARSREPI